MKGKKGSQGLINKKLITIIILAILLCLVLLAIFGLDVHSFFEALPDFLPGSGNPTNLEENAEIRVIPDPYSVEVTILLNDGDSRCIIKEAPKSFQNKPYEWLMNYGVKEWELQIKKGSWKTENTGIDWLTQEMIEKYDLLQNLRFYENFAALKIKQKIQEKASEDILSNLNLEYSNTFNSATNTNVLDEEVNLETFDNSKVPHMRSELERIKNEMNFEEYNMKLIKAEVNGEDKYLFQSTKNENYAIRNSQIYFNKRGWKVYSETDFSYEKLKNQVIKQELIKACYLDEDEFKETTILGKQVTLLKRDWDGKCFIYESPNNKELERYAVTKPIFKLTSKPQYYYLNDKGVWETDKAIQWESEELKQAEIAYKLIQAEEEIRKYLDSQLIKFCGSQNPKDPYCVDIDFSKDFKGIGQYELYNPSTEEKPNKYQYYLYESEDLEKSEPLGEAISKKILAYSDQNYMFFRRCQEENKGAPCYVMAKLPGTGTYAVREGKIYSFDSTFQEITDNPLIGLTDQELSTLANKNLIFEQLEKAC